eukprot:351287-Chlamydomonas_euryale.AAC.1
MTCHIERSLWVPRAQPRIQHSSRDFCEEVDDSHPRCCNTPCGARSAPSPRAMSSIRRWKPLWATPRWSTAGTSEPTPEQTFVWGGRPFPATGPRDACPVAPPLCSPRLEAGQRGGPRTASGLTESDCPRLRQTRGLSLTAADPRSEPNDQMLHVVIVSRNDDCRLFILCEVAANAGLEWWHVKERVCNEPKPDVRATVADFGDRGSRIFVWLSEDDCHRCYSKTPKGTHPISADQACAPVSLCRFWLRRMQVMRLKLYGCADYMLVLQGRLQTHLTLADFRTPGLKEEFAHFVCGNGANVTSDSVQQAMRTKLQEHAMQGWWSVQDNSDDRYELCIFPPSTSALALEQAYYFGP